jgi:hypothetical protein
LEELIVQDGLRIIPLVQFQKFEKMSLKRFEKTYLTQPTFPPCGPSFSFSFLPAAARSTFGPRAAQFRRAGPPALPLPLSSRCQAGPARQACLLPPAPPLLRGTAPPPIAPRLPRLLPPFKPPSRASKARPSSPPSIPYRFSSIKTPPPLNALKTSAMAIDGHHFGRRPSSPPCPIRPHPRASVAALFTHPRLPYTLPTSTGAARFRAAAAINGRPASTRHRLARPFLSLLRPIKGAPGPPLHLAPLPSPPSPQHGPCRSRSAAAGAAARSPPPP